jgi:glycosyltransferase involved in cell wall biosynthesis
LRSESADASTGCHSGRTILFLVTEDWYFWTHRLPVARAARQAGYRVVVATRVQAHGERILAEGLELRPLTWRRRGDGILGGLRALYAIWRLYRRERPDLVHHVAIKAIVFGSIAAFAARIPHQVNAIAGLGFAFTHLSPRTLAIRTMILLVFRLFVRRPGSLVIAQNSHDCNYLVERGVFSRDRIEIIRGSGVDVTKFMPAPEPPGKIVVTVVSRMLRHKGIEVFVTAAQLLRNRGLDLRFLLVGPIDIDSPAPLLESELRAWSRSGVVEWLGASDDIPAIWALTHIAAFPSFYREGIPLSLLEAAASGRPIVSTDIPGSREVVEHGINGFLVQENNPAALADAIETLARDRQLRLRMGQQARHSVERSFTTDIVIDQTLGVYRRLTGW